MPYTYPLRVPPGEHLSDEDAEHLAKYIDKQGSKPKVDGLRPHKVLGLLAIKHPDKFKISKKPEGREHRVYRLHHVLHHLKKLGWKPQKEKVPGMDDPVIVFRK